MREIYPICDETSYKKALEEMEPLFDNLPAPNSEDEIWLDSMVTLVEADEKAEISFGWGLSNRSKNLFRVEVAHAQEKPTIPTSELFRDE